MAAGVECVPVMPGWRSIQVPTLPERTPHAHTMLAGLRARRAARGADARPSKSFRRRPTSPAPPADATKTASGLASKVLKPGTGKAHPARTDLVTVHYTGWTTDGKMFDSSVSAGKPVDVPARPRHRRMDRRRAADGRRRKAPVLDSRGARLQGTAGPAERHAGVRRRAARVHRSRRRTAPADVKAAPADAKRTASGLAYKVLTPGPARRHPKSSSMVTVHYSGWTTDGKLFDSSVAAGQADHVSARRRDPRVDRRRAADGRRREDPLLDSRAARLQRPEGQAPYGPLVSSTSS